MKGVVFDIAEFSLSDGPGPRVTVFLKGCPLRCQWCHNPEGLRKEPQLFIRKSGCTHCGKCQAPCNHKECQPYARCLHNCPNGLVSVKGKMFSSEELADILNKQMDFYVRNGGGVTFSGGEPMMQSEFILDTVPRIHGPAAIETSGYAEPEVFRKVIHSMDFVIMDIKIADRELHKKYTGVYNDVILENYQYLKKSEIPYIIRTPMIHGICDTEENLRAISALIGDSIWERIPENSLWKAKYECIEN